MAKVASNSGPNALCGCGSGRKFKKCCRDGAGLLAEALALHERSDLTRAATVYLAALDTDPGQAAALHGIGVIAHQQGDSAKAISWLRRAAEARPASAIIHHSLGVALEGEHRWAEAAESFEAALEQDSGATASLLHLGIALREAGRLDPSAECFARLAAINGAPTAESFDAWNNLGVIRQQQGRFAKAADCFRRASDLVPDSPETHSNLGGALRMLGRLQEAAAELTRAVQLNPERAETRYNFGLVWKSLNEPERARAEFAEAVRINPKNESAHYFLQVLTGDHTPGATPAGLVTELFDGYADRFDAHLEGELGYRIPSMLKRMFDETGLGRPERKLDVLDLGCGTGLAGVQFHSVARRLCGVDLSPRMLDKARERGIYDELLQAEVGAALAAASRHADLGLDLILAADVFVYIGDLDPVFHHAALALRREGTFLFSVETVAGDDFQLSAAGRFQHPRAYIQALAAQHGFDEVASRPAIIRQERGQGVQGEIYLMSKTR